MKRLMLEMVFLGLVTAWRLAGSPTLRSPLPPSRNATILWVVRRPSLLGITTGSLPSITATHELVVPRSMPIILPMRGACWLRLRVECVRLEAAFQPLPGDYKQRTSVVLVTDCHRFGPARKIIRRGGGIC